MILQKEKQRVLDSGPDHLVPPASRGALSHEYQEVYEEAQDLPMTNRGSKPMKLVPMMDSCPY